MSNGKNPLMLMMALTMPGAANALGLGDIHVDSALNERLAAEIDIVGATPLDLVDLRAAVANRETFLLYGADRPSFLSSATFKVVQDSQGRPVLAVRSTEAFTEPMVNFLVDLRWHKSELVRQYTLLLDPPGFGAAKATAAARVADATRSADAPRLADAPAAPAGPDVPVTAPATRAVVETKTQTIALSANPPSDQPARTERSARKTTHIKVGARATLRGVAWRVGERSESDLQRMMIAIFRANPSAFDGNINRLHRGATLTIPTHSELAAISKADARHEFHAQMTAWRAGARTMTAKAAITSEAEKTVAPAMAATTVAATTAAATTAAAATAAAATAPTAAPAARQAASPAATSADKSSDESADALDHRIQSLEQELSQLKGVLDSEHDQMVTLQQQASLTEKATSNRPAAQSTESPAAAGAASVEESQSNSDPEAPSKTRHTGLVSVIAGLGLLAGTLAGIYFKFRRRPKPANTSAGETEAVPLDAMADTTLGSTLAQTQESVGFDAAKEPAQERIRDDAADHAQTDVLDILTGRSDDATQPLLPIVTAPSAGRSQIAAAPRTELHDTTVNMQIDSATATLRVDTTQRVDTSRLDYNLVDLDLTAQHVQMPSVLNEHAVVKERRTNLADVLKLAIEREPDRHDLRMKLLELYYSAAATNRQAFLDVVQKFARDRDYLESDQWDKIAFMGRQIAAESPLFAEPAADDGDLADCA